MKRPPAFVGGTALYKKTVALIRAYANIAEEMEDAGYTLKEIEGIKKEIDYYLKLREEIRRASGETLDLKSYEADMRHLIDTYIQADDSIKVSAFDDMTLLDIIVNSGIADAINSLPTGIKKDQGAIAETIENNVRSKIIKDHLIDPAFFEEMSKLLDAVIQERKAKAISYAVYLEKIAFIAKTVKEGKSDATPDILKTQGQRAIYNNAGKDEHLAIQLDKAIKRVKRDGWRGNLAKEREIKAEIFKQITKYGAENGIDIANEPPEPYGIENKVEAIFNIIKAQEEY
ncbi:hypothetical protein [Aequorivita soesokkakensis]|uniref:hypothetical protein n=1 Tax=Aequorivita soesokkakensis TaxID=1385699 RepID=UPI00104228E0|nr:hypothetical protein [Aequorivita soesokkakensis]